MYILYINDTLYFSIKLFIPDVYIYEKHTLRVILELKYILIKPSHLLDSHKHRIYKTMFIMNLLYVIRFYSLH